MKSVYDQMSLVPKQLLRKDIINVKDLFWELFEAKYTYLFPKLFLFAK